MTLQFFRPIQALIILSVFVGFILSGNTAKAQALPCGSIIGLENTTEITSCDNPFEAEAGTPFEFIVEGIMVNDGETVFVEGSSTNNYLVTNTPFYAGHFEKMYKHDGNDYREVNIEELPITREDYNRYAIEFFGETNASTELYIDRLMGQPVDTNSPDWNRGDYIAFADYVEANHVPVRPALEASTYTLVVEENVIYSTQADKTWFDAIREVFIKTAHAQFSHGPRYVLTFIIAETIPEPTGASSVLFLPGIQASRLYSFEDGEENQLWEPNANSEVEELGMSASGGSINDIYTKDVVDEVAIPIFGGNIYKGFLGMLEDLVDDETINNYQAFAYDWRYSVEDVVLNGTRYQNEVRRAVEAVEALAEDSFSGKVTVIGHSNGGLVAKVLISELERQGKADLVDKVVFIGTPHLGTPKAIGTLLHGYDQQKLGGSVIDDSTARAVMNNMPGVYGLLPSEKYLTLADDPVISFDESSSTAQQRQYYGTEIEGMDEYINFLTGVERDLTSFGDTNSPYKANPALLNDQLELHKDTLDDWMAPSNIEVYEVVGTGLATIKGFEYKEFPCITSLCILGRYSKPYPIFTNQGDETVTSLSAEAYGGSKVKGVVDLKREGAQFLVSTKSHADMTESPTIQDYVDSIIRFPYLNETIEVPENFIDSITYTIIGSHSPVQINAQTNDGKKVGLFEGRILEEVSGSQYFELGGSSYIVMPKEIEYEVTVKGTGVGVYSLTIDTLNESDVQTNEFSYLGASTSPQMTAFFSASSTGFSTIKTDIDSDGDVDAEQTLDGLPVNNISYTYDTLISEIKLLQLKKIYKTVLLVQAQFAEYQSKKSKPKLEAIALRNLERTLKLYKTKNLITSSQHESIVDVINFLKK